MKAYKLFKPDVGQADTTHCKLAGDSQQPEQSHPRSVKSEHEYGAKTPHVAPAHGTAQATGDGEGERGEGGGGAGGGGVEEVAQQPPQLHVPPCSEFTIVPAGNESRRRIACRVEGRGGG